jgi:hypothetical protein
LPGQPAKPHMSARRKVSCARSRRRRPLPALLLPKGFRLAIAITTARPFGFPNAAGAQLSSLNGRARISG